MFKGKRLSKLTKIILIPLFLLLIWIIPTIYIILNYDTSISVWSYNHPNKVFNNINHDNLLIGNKITGEFEAKDKNLGIVALRFQTYIKPPFLLEDNILFRIKEKNTKEWHYENIYKDGLIYDVPFFPFGFPQIEDSKGKKYYFEIISLNGTPSNSVSLSEKYPILVSKYKYSKSELLSDRSIFSNFFIKKFYNSFLNPDIWFSSLIYLLPLLFYLIYQIWEYSLNNKKNILNLFSRLSIRQTYNLRFIHTLIAYAYLIIILLIVVDILIIQFKNEFDYIVLAYLWYLSVKLKKIDINITLKFAVFYLILSLLFTLLNSFASSEKAGVWAFIFLVIWTIQLIIYYKYSNESKSSIKKISSRKTI